MNDPYRNLTRSEIEAEIDAQKWQKQTCEREIVEIDKKLKKLKAALAAATTEPLPLFKK